MKKVCFFHPSSDLYGADKILLQIIREFSQFQCTVVLRSEGELVERIKNIGNVEVVITPYLPILARKYLNLKGLLALICNIFRFHAFSKKHHLSQFDILYFNTIATVPLLMFFRRHRCRIMHLHEITDSRKWVYKAIIRFILRRADVVMCVSEAVVRSLRKGAKKHWDKIFRVYNGIPVAQVDNTTPLIPEISACGVLKMALIGRIKPSMKGQNVLVEAVAMLTPQEKSKVHFFIVGSTVAGQEYMFDELVQFIRERGVDACITILPFVQQVQTVYAHVDVILVPSICEDSLPTTVLEAMSYGKMVIGSVSGGIPEMIDNYQNGILVTKGDASHLCDAIRYCIDNQDKIKIMGEAGFQKFYQNFTEEEFHRQYQHVLRNVLTLS